MTGHVHYYTVMVRRWWFFRTLACKCGAKLPTIRELERELAQRRPL